MEYKFGINITTFNRFEYLFKTLESLKKTIFIPNSIIKITDDNSTDINVINYLNNYSIENQNIELNFNENNIGSFKNYQKTILTFADKNIDFLISLDSDCIMNPNWLLEINKLINIFGENIICSSFCCKYHHGNPGNPLIEVNENYYERTTLNGLGICFPKYLIEDFKENMPAHFDSTLCGKIKQKHNMKCICTKVSFMQHIGLNGEHSSESSDSCDISDNFIGE